MNNINDLKTGLLTLTIFRELLGDRVISGLLSFLEKKDLNSYADFVAELYNANGGNISEYVREITGNSENIYVKTVGMGEQVPDYLRSALLSELRTLQLVSDITSEELIAELSRDCFLPGFANSIYDVTEKYLHRIDNIGKFGYGIYSRNRMFYVSEEGNIVPVLNPDKTRLSDLVDYEMERNVIIDNTRALLEGKPAANILLTGDAGTGKSSSVKAVANEFFTEGLRVIEVRKDQLRTIQKILNELSANPLKFILFIDDLSFLKDDDNFNALKAVLEGSVTAKSSNVVIYATSNRRHIIKESFSDREGDEIHRNDTMQELVSLSERFGIHITFSKPNKATFLNIVHHLAEEKGITLPAEELELQAERFALERGGRSARLARQFIDKLLAK